MSRDLYNNIEVRRAESPVAAAQTNNDPIVSEVIDMQGFDSMVFAVALGTLADAAFTTVFLLEESDTDFSGSAVADADMDPVETVAAFDNDDDDEVRKIGYNGSKRYVRLTITPSDNTGNLPIAIIAILSHAHVLPTTEQAT